MTSERDLRGTSGRDIFGRHLEETSKGDIWDRHLKETSERDIWSLESGIWSLEAGIWSLASGICNLGPGAGNLSAASTLTMKTCVFSAKGALRILASPCICEGEIHADCGNKQKRMIGSACKLSRLSLIGLWSIVSVTKATILLAIS